MKITIIIIYIVISITPFLIMYLQGSTLLRGNNLIMKQHKLISEQSRIIDELRNIVSLQKSLIEDQEKLIITVAGETSIKKQESK